MKILSEPTHPHVIPNPLDLPIQSKSMVTKKKVFEEFRCKSL